MSSIDTSVWAALALLVAAVVGIRLRPKKGSPKRRPEANSPIAKLKGKSTDARGGRTSGGNTGGDYEQASPGQFGNGATRDLTPTEIAKVQPSYAPNIDGDPDPGEVVWTWVPYVENDGRGKDRPVLIIANLGGSMFAACYLSTKEHRGFVSVGSGAWDSQGRESFMSTERVLAVSESGMRREGARVPKPEFDRAVAALRRAHGIGG